MEPLKLKENKKKRNPLFAVILLSGVIAAVFLFRNILLVKNPINLPAPDKIIIYSNGKITELNSKTAGYSEILSLANKRLNNSMEESGATLPERIIDIMKNTGVGIEFLYKDNKSYTYYCKTSLFVVSKHTLDFQKLYFPIETDSTFNDCMLMGSDTSYNPLPLAKLKAAEELAQYIKNNINSKKTE